MSFHVVGPIELAGFRIEAIDEPGEISNEETGPLSGINGTGEMLR